MAEINREKLETLIFAGLKEGYIDSYSFTGEINSIIKPEYLLTVNIAKKIKELNDEAHAFGSPLIIKLEEPTRSFATACAPPHENLSLFNTLYREDHNPTRNGKIDIALYTHTSDAFDKIPYAAIEIKGFISTKAELTQDIIRNLYYLNIKDKKTGNSRLKHSYLVCIHEHKGAKEESEKKKKIENLEKGYKKYLEKFNTSKEFDFYIKGDTIAEYLIKDSDQFLPTDILEGIAELAIHYIGILIRTEKKTK